MRHAARLLVTLFFSVFLQLPMAGPLAARTPTPTFGNSPTPTPTSNRPVPQARIRVSPNPARSGSAVILDGGASTGAILSFEWSVVGEAAGVVISNPSSAIASFVAPAVSEVTTITIQLFLRSYGGTASGGGQVEVVLLPPDTVRLVLGPAHGAPGDTVSFAATFHSAGAATTEIEHALDSEVTAPIAATETGAPDCAFDPSLGAITASSSFRFAPEGCVPGDGCDAVTVSLRTDEAIPDGILYRCNVELTLEDAASCESELRCREPRAVGPSGPLVLDCVDGEVRSDFSERRARFAFHAEPAEPRVGDVVSVSVFVSGSGGLPSYRLLGAQPFLAGDTGPVVVSGPLGDVRFDLRAACPGTANLRLSVQYETTMGCPGNQFFGFTGDTSEVFALEVIDASQFVLSGIVTEFPLCQGAMRGVTVTLNPLGLATQTNLSNGGFSFAVPPGDYTLTVSPACNPFGCWPETPVSVIDQDVFVSVCPVNATPTVTSTETPTAPAPPTLTATAPGSAATPTPTVTPTETPTTLAPTLTATATGSATPIATTTPTATFTSSVALTPTATPTADEMGAAGGDGGCSIRAGGGRERGSDAVAAIFVLCALWLLRRTRRSGR